MTEAGIRTSVPIRFDPILWFCDSVVLLGLRPPGEEARAESPSLVATN